MSVSDVAANDNKPRGEARSALWPVAIAIILASMTILVFWHVVQCGFVLWDDPINLYNNPYMQPVTWAGIRHLWTRPYFDLYIPVTYTCWAAIAHEWHLSQPVYTDNDSLTTLSPVPFHVASLAVHVVNAILMFVLLRLLLQPRAGGSQRNWAAGAGALLFAVHPLQTEAVAWNSEFRGLLSGFFGLLTLITYLSFVERRRQERPQWWLYTIGTVLFGASLLSKPTIVILPLIAISLEIWLYGIERLRSIELVLPLGGWLGLGAAMALITGSVQSVPASLKISSWRHLLVSCDSLCFYLWKLVAPIDLGADYGRTPQVALHSPLLPLAVATPIIITIILWRLRGTEPALLLAWAIFVVALLPVLGLKAFIYQTTSTVADRYVYLPMLGPSILVAWWLLKARSIYPWALTAGILIVCAYLASVQTEYWTNSLSLATQAVAVNPRSFKFQCMVGMMKVADGRYEEAIDHYRDAIQIEPTSSSLHNDYGIALSSAGHPDAAVPEFKLAAHLDPTNAAAWNDLGSALAQTGDLPDAESAFRSAIRHGNNFERAHENLANVLGLENRYAEEIAEFQAAARIYPANPKIYWQIGNAFLDLHDPTDAAAEFRVSLRLDPNNAQALAGLRTAMR